MLRIDTPKQDLETNCIGDANHKRETKTFLSWSPKYQRPSPLRSPHPVDHAKVAVPVSTPPLPMRSTNIPSIHSRLRLKPRAGAPAQGPRTEQRPVTRQTLAAVLMISWLPFKANWADNFAALCQRLVWVCTAEASKQRAVVCFEASAMHLYRGTLHWLSQASPKLQDMSEDLNKYVNFWFWPTVTGRYITQTDSPEMTSAEHLRIADEQRCCTCLHVERKQTWGFNMIYSARMGIDFNTFVGTYVHFSWHPASVPYHDHSFIYTPHHKRIQPHSA